MYCQQSSMVWTLTLLILWSSVPRRTLAVDCDVQQIVQPNEGTYFYSPGFPNSYRPGESETWCISAADNTKISLICDRVEIPKSVDCKMDYLAISSSKDQPRSFCGSGSFRVQSSTNDMVVALHSSRTSPGGKFLCNLKV